MNYRLKRGQENIQIMSGPFAGKKFIRGVEYSEIPTEEKGRFERVPEPKKLQDPRTATEKATEKTATKKTAGGGDK